MSKMKVVRKKISFLVKKKFLKNFEKNTTKTTFLYFGPLKKNRKKKKKKSKLYFSKVEGLLKTPGSGDV